MPLVFAGVTEEQQALSKLVKLQKISSSKARTLSGCGKYADMIILNLVEIPQTDIYKTKVQQTLFKGEIVCEAK